MTMNLVAEAVSAILIVLGTHATCQGDLLHSVDLQ